MKNYLSIIMLAILLGLVACERTVKIRLIDKTGKIVIEPQFKAVKLLRYQNLFPLHQWIEDYVTEPQYFVGLQFDYLFKTEDGSIYVIVDGKCNLVDTTISPKFDAICLFSDHLACVKINGKYGFIDSTGKIVVEPQFDRVCSLCNGFAGVEINNKVGFVNKYGQIVVEPQFTRKVDEFYEGLACVQVDEKYGYIDTTGKMVIEPQFEDAYNFSDGLAKVRTYDKSGYVNTIGKMVIETQFETYCFSDGLSLVRVDGKWGFINTQGEIVIEPQYDFAEDFKNGFALVGIGGEIKWFIDKAGNKVNDSIRQSIIDKEPLIAVEKKEYTLSVFVFALEYYEDNLPHFWDDWFYKPQYGFVDKTGKIVIDFQFEDAKDFSDGLAVVKVNGKYGYIDKSGKMVIEPQFDYANSFKNGFALIGMN